MAETSQFSYPHAIVRWTAAVFIIFATYNPSGRSYFHWFTDFADDRWSLKILVGLVLLILIFTFVVATLRSIGVTGMVTTAAFFGSVIWALVDNGYLRALGLWAWVTIVLLLVGSLLAVGVSWSHIRNRLSGQSDSNDVTL